MYDHPGPGEGAGDQDGGTVILLRMIEAVRVKLRALGSWYVRKGIAKQTDDENDKWGPFSF